MEVEVMVAGVNDGTNPKQVGIKHNEQADWPLYHYFRTLI
jgi:hypothetical protein